MNTVSSAQRSVKTFAIEKAKNFGAFLHSKLTLMPKGYSAFVSARLHMRLSMFRVDSHILLPAFLSALFLCAMNADAKFLGYVSNGRDPVTDEPLLEKPSKNYGISCVAEIDGASIFTQPDIKHPYKDHDGSAGKWVGSKGIDLTDVRIVYVKGRQFLSGKIVQYAAGGRTFTLEKSAEETIKGEETDRLYALPEEWECRLYKGDREASCSSDAVVGQYVKLLRKYETECKKEK